MIKESGGSRTSPSTELLYLPRTSGVRGLRSVESKCELTKVKAAVKLFSNRDDTMSMVGAFKEKCVQKGRRSLKNDATKYAAEMGISLELIYPDSEVYNEAGEKIKSEAVGKEWRKKEPRKREQAIRDHHWQGKFFKE